MLAHREVCHLVKQLIQLPEILFVLARLKLVILCKVMLQMVHFLCAYREVVRYSAPPVTPLRLKWMLFENISDR